MNKVTSHTDGQPIRAKPRPPPPPPSALSHPIPIHPPVNADDQSLDFSLLHTMKNVYGQIKVKKNSNSNKI